MPARPRPRRRGLGLISGLYLKILREMSSPGRERERERRRKREGERERERVRERGKEKRREREREIEILIYINEKEENYVARIAQDRTQ